MQRNAERATRLFIAERSNARANGARETDEIARSALKMCDRSLVGAGAFLIHLGRAARQSASHALRRE